MTAADDEPGAVIRSDRIDQLVWDAMEIAASIPVDDVAVGRLRARIRRRDMSRVGTHLRFDYWIKEDPIADRANRLLVAAASGEPVRPLKEDERRRFERIETLVAMSFTDGFKLLAAVEPSLRRIESTLCAKAADLRGRDGDLDSKDAGDLWGELTDMPAPVLGPDSQASDELLRTNVAAHVARVHIGQQAGLPFDD